ncbi:hypothetical protein ACB098_09G083300 [Castanea mollissima]
MLQPELIMDSIFDQVEHPDFNLDCLGSEFSSIPCPIYDVSQQIFLNDEIESMYGGLEDIFPTEVGILNPLQSLPSEGEDSFSPSQSMNSESLLTDVVSVQSSLTLPGEDMEIDKQLGLFHLLKAYGDVFEKDQRELGQVILRRISEKGSPVGKTLERLALYLSKDSEINQGENLKQESLKNFKAAFQALYQALPDGKFAHFAANSAILEAIPDDVETIHTVDFDMGEEEDCNGAPLWRFEETKRRLYDRARAFGLKLKAKRGGRRKWLIFNCMVGLPHMGRGRSRSLAMDFLRAAEELIAISANCSTIHKGIITFGDGEACEKLKNCSDFGSFFEGYLVHYKALLESLEKNFPLHFTEARIALECHFVAPYISSLAWFQRWKEIRGGCHLEAGLGLVGKRLSKEIFMEAREMVEEEENKYRIKIEGHIGNEMVLEWKRNTTVRISNWTNHS